MLFQENPDVNWMLFKSRQKTDSSLQDNESYIENANNPINNDDYDNLNGKFDWLLFLQIIVIIVNIITLIIIGFQLGKVSRQGKEVIEQISQTQESPYDNIDYIPCPRCGENAISLQSGEDTYIVCPDCDYKVKTNK